VNEGEDKGRTEIQKSRCSSPFPFHYLPQPEREKGLPCGARLVVSLLFWWRTIRRISLRIDLMFVLLDSVSIALHISGLLLLHLVLSVLKGLRFSVPGEAYVERSS